MSWNRHKQPTHVDTPAGKSKLCRQCGELRLLTQYQKKAAAKDGLTHRCKVCTNTNDQGRWNKLPYEKKRAAGLRKYGLTISEYGAMVERQANTCQICTRQFVTAPHVDHDHTSGKVRGLLCTECNKGLGHFRDDIESLERAATYLRKSLCH